MNKGVLLFIILLGIAPLVQALDSDQEQPATLEANDFELDLKTGVRTYRGDVLFRQGSIRLECDELVTYFNDAGELDKGVCSGDPGRFKQRPEGSEDDMIGTARVITMDQAAQLVTLESRAVATQGVNTLSGRLITYRLDTEKVVVKSEPGAARATVTADSGNTSSSADSDDSSTSEAPATSESTDTGRARLVIQPRKKKN